MKILEDSIFAALILSTMTRKQILTILDNVKDRVNKIPIKTVHCDDEV